jgi:hypothetical protein
MTTRPTAAVVPVRGPPGPKQKSDVDVMWGKRGK